MDPDSIGRLDLGAPAPDGPKAENPMAPPEPVADTPPDEGGLADPDPLGLGQMTEQLWELEETPSGPMTFDQVQALKKRRTAKIPLVLDMAARDAVVEARLAVQDAEKALAADPMSEARQGALQAAMEAEAEAIEAMEAVTMVWRVKSISRTRIRKLIAMCPPTQEQRAQFKNQQRGLGRPAGEPLYDPDRFAPALVALCSIEPELTSEQAAEMWESDDWTEGELNAIFQTAWTLNQVAI